MKFRLTLLAAVAATVAATTASAATVSANAVANATIVAPATMTATRTLEFGTIAKPTTGVSTITVNSGAAASVTPVLSGAGNAFVPTAGQARAATFRLVGTPNQAIAVNTTSLNFTNQGGNFTNVGPQSPVASVGTLTQLPAGGMDDFFVGGHFDISPTTTAQAYTGTLTLAIDFN
ncbi:MAG: DUF4402 domain-containing protein [Alphaproteobacteria bacterium]|nr:DUF4402 domain-containing protein [Alphaproteobacteria bacterium]MBU1513872.1 DUF4402 domain-containing protein [Alphaproteobacteria bacterium]MBU2094483.1 DUF4402 domain-containing protein [Alphaproteobacteria bacterium]MBU2149791.1 DUF4402 domain-containing protein [Alphaproteobacteria bacterium]MBU2307262.1 DUF4402 domain-containing protein [Alphaproteobacteria bacterium]